MLGLTAKGRPSKEGIVHINVDRVSIIVSIYSIITLSDVEGIIFEKKTVQVLVSNQYPLS